MDDRQAFLAQIEADPLNHLLRCVYADWLDERGESDEATRQRRWVGAYEFLLEFADPYKESREEGDAAATYKMVLETAGYWLSSLADDGEICFGDDDAPIKLEEEAETRDKFYRSLEVVTGTAITAATRERASFRCAC